MGDNKPDAAFAGKTRLLIIMKTIYVFYNWSLANGFSFTIMEVWGFCPIISPKNQPHISCTTVFVGHSQAQKYLQINPNPFPKSRYEIVKISYFN